MKHSIATFIFLGLLFISCEEEQKTIQSPEKEKTIIVDKGSFDMGEANNGSSFPTLHAKPKTINIEDFYRDQSEITSTENRTKDDEDVPFLHTKRKKTVSVHAFYMDQNESTSNNTNTYACPGIDLTKK